MPNNALVLDANILVRAVLGKRHLFGQIQHGIERPVSHLQAGADKAVVQEALEIRSWNRPDEQAFPKAIERTGRFRRHLNQHSSLRAGKDIAQRGVLLHGAAELALGTPAA